MLGRKAAVGELDIAPVGSGQLDLDLAAGFRCSAALWGNLLGAGASLRDPARLVHIPKTLPLLLIAGSADPVSAGAHGPELLLQAYKAAGIKDVAALIYDGARHELLNEIPSCRDEVTTDLLHWLDQRR